MTLYIFIYIILVASWKLYIHITNLNHISVLEVALLFELVFIASQ